MVWRRSGVNRVSEYRRLDGAGAAAGVGWGQVCTMYSARKLHRSGALGAHCQQIGVHFPHEESCSDYEEAGEGAGSEGEEEEHPA
jgi:hypothetical protein